MKKSVVMLASVAVLLVTDVFAMNRSKSVSISNIAKKQKLKRVDSRARLSILKDKDLLPAPMSTEEYIDMLKKFLTDNNQLIDPTELIKELDAIKERAKEEAKWLSDLQQDFSFNPKDYLEYKSFINEHEALFYQTEENTNPHLPKDTKIIDISCPNIMILAFKLIARDKISEEDPTNISSDQHLKWSHLAWIVKYFADHVNKIQSHEIDPDDKYDSGLTDDEIDLLIKLTVGPNRLFNIFEMSKTEQNEFTTDMLKPILRNATGFQRILSLLITSIARRECKQNTWQCKVSFFEGSDPSFQENDKICFNKAYKNYTPFHEITHLFHHMMDIDHSYMNLISNISMINSRDIDLIEQYFPMLRPHIMNPILKQIKELIDQYFGRNFEKLKEEEKQKIAIVVLEPIIRNAMMAGFGNFIFPVYKPGQALKISINMLTTGFMAKCIYLQGILGSSSYYSEISDENSVFVQSNMVFPSRRIQHPIFNKIEVSLKNLKQDGLWFGKEYLWHSAEERLTMQGNMLESADGMNFYIQDRQNEHIYRMRFEDDKSNISKLTTRQFRYHSSNIQETFQNSIVATFLNMLKCGSLLDTNIGTIVPQLVSLNVNLATALQSSVEKKYTLPSMP